jgi:hypothetical protein
MRELLRNNGIKKLKKNKQRRQLKSQSKQRRQLRSQLRSKSQLRRSQSWRSNQLIRLLKNSQNQLNLQSRYKKPQK